MFGDIENEHLARNYDPLDIVVSEGKGSWLTDVEDREYLDCLAAYSAVNFGHSNDLILDALFQQAKRVAVVSRAVKHDQLEPFADELCELTGKEMILPMNSGAEGVETALKTARKWATLVKGVPENKSNIVVMDNNFHGRTISIISFSKDEVARRGFGPYTPGFRSVPYSDADALREAIDENTAAVLLEPIQGEAGIIVPGDGYLQDVRNICTENNVLMIADEIQSGLGRTGKTFACDHENVVPDIYIMGKALGGGVLPLSAVAANRDILGVFKPGEHGSTFGGNPLACAVGRKVIEILKTGEYQEKASDSGLYLRRRLGELVGNGLTSVRGKGLWAGTDIHEDLITGKEASKRMSKKGVIVKDTHGQTLRFAPPLGTAKEDLDFAVDAFAEVLDAAAK